MPKATVVRVEKVEPHPNADHLDLIQIKGEQTVVGRGEFKAGDLAAWIPAGLVVPDTKEFAFIGNDYNRQQGSPEFWHIGTLPESCRTIRPRRFRGQWSRGLLMPLFNPPIPGIRFALYRHPPRFLHVYSTVYPGADITELLGITRPCPPKYIEGFSDDYDEGFEDGRKYVSPADSLRAWLSSFGFSLPQTARILGVKIG